MTPNYNFKVWHKTDKRFYDVHAVFEGHYEVWTDPIDKDEPYRVVPLEDAILIEVYGTDEALEQKFHEVLS